MTRALCIASLALVACSGDPGPEGFEGAPGEQGPVGDRGAIGDGGKIGIKGNAGPRGPAAGAYCGATAETTGALGGYPQAGDLCVSACGDDIEAHVCSGGEMVRAAGDGTLPIQTLRFASGVALSATARDCDGFKSASGAFQGAVWIPSLLGGAAQSSPCSSNLPLACCR
jgi:hypothetical protein